MDLEIVHALEITATAEVGREGDMKRGDRGVKKKRRGLVRRQGQKLEGQLLQ
jgi:hypothetical protein